MTYPRCDSRGTRLINDIFSGYYSLIVAALVILVPLWFGSFVIQALEVLFRRDRD